MKKYKLKTHKATAKRIKVTGSNKLTRSKQSGKNNAHLKNKRHSTRKLKPEAFQISAKGEVKRIRRLLPGI